MLSFLVIEHRPLISLQKELQHVIAAAYHIHTSISEEHEQGQSETKREAHGQVLN